LLATKLIDLSPEANSSSEEEEEPVNSSIVNISNDPFEDYDINNFDLDRYG